VREQAVAATRVEDVYARIPRKPSERGEGASEAGSTRGIEQDETPFELRACAPL
jgi:hypothetical protein